MKQNESQAVITAEKGEMVMSVFDKVKKGMSVAGEKSAALVETGKLQAEIASLKQKKKSKFQEMGELVYQMIKEENLDEEKLKGIFEEVQEIESKIEEKEKEKSEV